MLHHLANIPCGLFTTGLLGMTWWTRLTEDPCGLFTAGVMLWLCGQAASDGKPLIRKVGASIAGVALLATFLYGLCRHADLLGNIVVSMALGFFAIGSTWSILSLATFIREAMHPKPKQETNIIPPATPIERDLQTDKQEALAKKKEDERRRAAARANCDVFYSRHAPELKERFSREAFDAFLEKHLGDKVPMEDVVRMADELVGILEAHLHKADPPTVETNLVTLLASFDKQQQKLEESDIDGAVKDMLLSDLRERREEAVTKLIREMET